MTKDLTTSNIHRNNVLNNRFALEALEKEVAHPGIVFEGTLLYTKRMVADYYDVDERTIDRYLDTHSEELSANGYEVLNGTRLKAFKKFVEDNVSEVDDVNDVDDINVVNMDKNLKKTPRLGVFTFRTFLNIGMVLTESEQAKTLRSLILDIVIDTLNKKIGGSTKYINQREEEFVSSAIREHDYRKEFTNAIDEYIEPNKFKYGLLTDKIYLSIFKEKSKEYRQILKLKAKENVRATMYAEVLDLIASYENGFAKCLRKKNTDLGRKLRVAEAIALFREFEEDSNAIYEPLTEKARSLMASRDIAFRDALHEKLANYITSISPDEVEKFLGERSKALEERILENIEIFKRLKDR